ncbi:hypothetical protein [Nitrobacter sp.]|uniref:hypothetical protein n=1 Tax=Nitrobacter sp. TaxID=29420 RepID=UPI0029CAB9AB|nr:hypothetical protein [Nitrobacter sp.]
MIDPNEVTMALGAASAILSAIMLYATSKFQRLFRRRLPTGLSCIASAFAMLASVTCWGTIHGKLVGLMVALAIWMTASIALPLLLARRHR